MLPQTQPDPLCFPAAERLAALVVSHHGGWGLAVMASISATVDSMDLAIEQRPARAVVRYERQQRCASLL